MVMSPCKTHCRVRIQYFPLDPSMQTMFMSALLPTAERGKMSCSSQDFMMLIRHFSGFEASSVSNLISHNQNLDWNMFATLVSQSAAHLPGEFLPRYRLDSVCSGNVEAVRNCNDFKIQSTQFLWSILCLYKAFFKLKCTFKHVVY